MDLNPWLIGMLAPGCAAAGAGVMALIKDRAREVGREDAQVRTEVLASEDRVRAVARAEVGAEIRIALAEFEVKLPKLLNGDNGYRRKPECLLIEAAMVKRLDTMEQGSQDTAAQLSDLHHYAHEFKHAFANNLQTELIRLGLLRPDKG